MFNLPDCTNPEELLGHFNFSHYEYEVCFETYEEECGFLGIFFTKTVTKKRYWIVRKSRLVVSDKEKVEFFCFNSYCKDMSNRFEFKTAENYTNRYYSGNMVYWDNSADPVNFLTFLKGRLDEDSRRDLVVFSSRDLD